MSVRTLVDLYGKLAKGFRYIVYFDENDYLYIANLTCIYTDEYHGDYTPNTKCNPVVAFTTNPKYAASADTHSFTYDGLYNIIRDNYSDSIDQNGVVNITEKIAFSLLNILDIFIISKSENDKRVHTHRLDMDELTSKDIDANNLYCLVYPNTNQIIQISHSTMRMIREIILSIYNRNK